MVLVFLSAWIVGITFIIWCIYYVVHRFGCNGPAEQADFQRIKDGEIICAYCEHKSGNGDGRPRCNIKELSKGRGNRTSSCFKPQCHTKNNEGKCEDFIPKWWVKRRIDTPAGFDKDKIIDELLKKNTELEAQFLKAAEEARTNE